MSLIEIASENAAATFDPNQGLNMTSLKIQNIEIMAQSTRDQFDARCAGLGALIGPHFHHREPVDIQWPKDPNLFPHFELLRKQGTSEPFSHGIARYVPWSILNIRNDGFEAILRGDDKYKSVPLKDLEGQNFEMKFSAQVLDAGIEIHYSIASEKPSVIGFHYYYQTDPAHAFVNASIQAKYNDGGKIKDVPGMWTLAPGSLTFKVANTADYGFRSLNPDSNRGDILLQNPDYQLNIHYQSDSDDHQWQLYRPQDVDFVCIEPMSSKAPRKPVRNKSTLTLRLDIDT